MGRKGDHAALICIPAAIPRKPVFNGLVSYGAPAICRNRRIRANKMPRRISFLVLLIGAVTRSLSELHKLLQLGPRRAINRCAMDPLAAMAASGMRSRMESLDLLANNIANASTGGYKADREFYSLYAAPEAGSDGCTPCP